MLCEVNPYVLITQQVYADIHPNLVTIPFAADYTMIGASNFFELSVAVAVALFGTTSPAALATTVGVLTEVPVMLTLVKIANNTKAWFPGHAEQ